MSNACVETKYFSGQGALLLGDRDINGEAAGLLPVGRVGELAISVETTEQEIKETCSGGRLVDKVLVQEVNATVTMTLSSFNKANLALALYGQGSSIVGASVTNEVRTAYLDKWVPLANIKVSAVVITNVAGTTTYVLGTDYLLNTDAGSFMPLSTGAITASQTLHVDYTFAAQDNIEVVTSSAAPIRYARFEGLNTADTNKPVIVDIFKLSTKPLAELPLINDEALEMPIEAKVLADALHTVGSQYMRIRYIA